jgi:hypothetical protein
VSIIVVFIVILVLGAICLVKNREDKSAYKKWIEHYKTPQPQQENIDIHHFYNRQAPPFTPHISVENKKRYSVNTQRLSINPQRNSSINSVL